MLYECDLFWDWVTYSYGDGLGPHGGIPGPGGLDPNTVCIISEPAATSVGPRNGFLSWGHVDHNKIDIIADQHFQTRFVFAFDLPPDHP